MKIFKRGFTLAEVLVTMALLGVVAAMTVPTMMMDGKYKQYVAKTAKFYSSLENAATEFAITHDDFSSTQDVQDFMARSIIYKNGSTNVQFQEGRSPGANLNAELKDGTIIQSVYVDNKNVVPYKADTSITGDGYFHIFFNPNVPGVRSNNNQSLGFEVTEKGYVFPLAERNSDDVNLCLKALYDNKWKYNPALFKSNGVCAP